MCSNRSALSIATIMTRLWAQTTLALHGSVWMSLASVCPSSLWVSYPMRSWRTSGFVVILTTSSHSFVYVTPTLTPSTLTDTSSVATVSIIIWSGYSLGRSSTQWITLACKCSVSRNTATRAIRSRGSSWSISMTRTAIGMAPCPSASRCGTCSQSPWHTCLFSSPSLPSWISI